MPSASRSRHADLAATQMLSPTRGTFVLRYALLVGLPLLGLLGMLHLGRGLVSAGLEPAALDVLRPGAPLDLPLLLGQIVVVLGACWLAGRVVAALGQPAVVGEMAAGILLGPSVLGVLAPGAFAWVFPAGSIRFINALSQVGLLFFMFLVGLRLDARHVRARGHTAVVTSHASIIAPLLLGAALSLLLFPLLAPRGVTFTGFALFVGTAMSITAFPVLARILAERKLTGTPLGTLAIACAAVDDVTAWCILAAVIALVRHGREPFPLWATLGGTAVYVAVMATLGRRALRWVVDRLGARERVSRDVLGVFVLVVLASAWVTERLGIHALFGAFLAGTIVPRYERLVRGLVTRIEDIMLVLLLPLFFAYTGLRTEIGTLATASLWLLCGLVTAVAVAGKFGGTAVAARLAGTPWREAAALGTLMNTRGLMELVILNIGYELGVVSAPLFAMMVLMALVTTIMTTPVLHWLRPRSDWAADAVAAGTDAAA